MLNNMKMTCTLLSLLLLMAGCAMAQDYQPAVVTVEKLPATKSLGSISMPEGSPWCDGRPAYWLVGHQPEDTPWCLDTNSTTTDFTDYNYTGSQWEKSSVAVMDRSDELNAVDGPENIDRHDCVTLDINQDNVTDILCGVGANKGEGFGYNEVYLTQPEDNELGPKGSLVKVLRDHNLNQFPTMRNRLMAKLKGTDGSSLILLATEGKPRADGKPNQHRMFRLEHRGPLGFKFRHVPGPWVRHTYVNCLQIADINQDGLDDIVMCNGHNRPAFIFLQGSDGSWSRLDIRMYGWRARNWSNARVADVTGDGVPDLVVVGTVPDTVVSYIRIFEGTKDPPYLSLSKGSLVYERILDYRAPDLEVLDVNSDGVADIYVVQYDSSQGNYCSRSWTKPWKGPQPDPDYIPPNDEAPDLLLLGSAPGLGFTEVLMDHAEPGCGTLVELFGNNRTLIVAQSDFDQVGHNLLLQW